MIPAPSREQQFSFLALQKALTSGAASVRIDFRRLNRHNSPFFNPWENVLPLVAVMLISFGLMFTDNLIIGVCVLVLLVALYVIVMPYILAPVMRARVLKRIVPRMEKFLIAWHYGGIALVLNADPSVECRAPLGNWEKFVKDYFDDLTVADEKEEAK